MKKNRKSVSKNEMMKGKWKRQIMLEKDYTEQCSEWMAERLEALIEYMQYGHAAGAYMKQDGTFKLVNGTLVGYEKDFGMQYDPMEIKNTVGYRDVEQQRWMTFKIENFMEWRAIV